MIKILTLFEIMSLMGKYLQHAPLLWLDSRRTSATSTSANDNIKLMLRWITCALQSQNIINFPPPIEPSITTVLMNLSRAPILGAFKSLPWMLGLYSCLLAKVKPLLHSLKSGVSTPLEHSLNRIWCQKWAQTPFQTKRFWRDLKDNSFWCM